MPIFETERLVRRFVEKKEYYPRLVNSALAVSKASAEQFSADDKGLAALLDEISSQEYVVTRRSRQIMEGLLKDIYGDGLIYKGFENEIEPLCEVSQPLRQATKLADSLADRTKESSIDVARALMIKPPKYDREEL